MAKYIDIPFATNGNKTAIPDTTTDGTVNYNDGFGADYAKPIGTDPSAKSVDRETINQALYDYGSAIQQLQENGFYTWQSTKAGGYDIGAAVSYSGANYINTVAGNTNAPDVSGWTQIIDKAQITGSTPLAGLNADVWTGTSRDTLVASLRANVNINGGGTITWDSNGYFNASERFIVVSNGRGAFFCTSGFFDITIPTSGTIIGVGGAGNATVTSAGVPIGDWDALYYILPIGSGNTSLPANFRIVKYNNNIIIPDNWVLIAMQNDNSSALAIAGGKYTLHKGESIDTGTYSSAFVPNTDLVRGLPADFTSSKAANGYQKLPSGVIMQWGSTGSIPKNSSATITLPIAMPNKLLSVAITVTSPNSICYAPIASSYTTGNFNAYNSDGAARVCEYIALGY